MYLPKRYATGVATLSIAAVSLLSLPAQAQKSAAADPVVPENLYAVVKLPPLQTLTSNIMSVVRKVEPGPQSEMLPMLFLGSFGYPSFPGVSATDGISLFILKGESESDIKFVAYAKISQDSPTRAALTSEDFGIKVKESEEGWTLLARGEEDFTAVKDSKALAALASDKTDFGVEARFYISPASKEAIRSLVSDAIAENVDKEDKAKIARAKAWEDFGLKLLDNYLWVGYGLSLNADTLSIGLVATPKAGTPDATLLAAPLKGGKVEQAKVFSAKETITVVSQTNPAALDTYLKWLSGVAKTAPDAKASKLLSGAIDQYAAFMKQSDGKTAAVMTKFDLEAGDVGEQSVMSGKFEQAKVDVFYKYLSEGLMPEALEVVADMTGMEPSELNKYLKIEFKSDVKKIGKFSVSSFGSVVSNPEGDEKAQESVSYYTVVKGNLVAAGDLDTLESLVKKVEAGKPVADNLADALPLAAGAQLRGTIDLAKIVVTVLKSELKDQAAWDKSPFKALESVSVKPLELSGAVSEGRLIYRVDASVDSLINLYKAFEAASAVGEEVEVQTETIEVVPAQQ